MQPRRKQEAVEYARNNFEKAYQYMINNAITIYWYSTEVIKGRWFEAEPIIQKEPKWACHYASNVIHGHWLEAEPNILGNEVEKIYCTRWKIKPEELIPIPDYIL